MAVYFSSISQLHLAERATARTPLARQPSNEPTRAQQELARTVSAAAATPAASSSGTTSATTAAGAASSSNSLLPTAAAATTTAPASLAGPLTAESVFGQDPWLTNPTGTGPTGSYTYNPYYFATPQTAATVASMVGGKVVAYNAVGGPSTNPFIQDQPNQMVQLASGTTLNPGLVASFYTHGYPQSMVDQMIANEVANVSKGN